jgi:hypothetical protein
VITVVGAALGFFLNRVGLPEPVKQHFAAQLQAQGWVVEFSRLRLRWYRGIVVDDLTLARSRPFSGPQVFVERAQCPLDYTALLRRRLEVNAVTLRGGRVALPLPSTNDPPAFVMFNDAQGTLILRDDDCWDLQDLQATVLGIRLQVSGTLSNASRISRWRLGAREPGRAPAASAWSQVVETARQVRWSGAPVLEAEVRADAATFEQLSGRLVLKAAAVQSPWARGSNVTIQGWLLPATKSKDHLRADLHLACEGLQTRWGDAERLRLTAQAEPSAARLLSPGTTLSLELTALKLAWGSGGNVKLQATYSSGAATHASAWTDLSFRVGDVQTRWGKAGAVEGNASLALQPQKAFALTNRLSITASHWSSRWGAADQLTAALSLSPPQGATGPAPAHLQVGLRRATTPWGSVRAAGAQAQATWPGARGWDDLRTNFNGRAWLETTPIEVNAELSDSVWKQLGLAQTTLRGRWQSPWLDVDATSQVGSGGLAVTGQWQSSRREFVFGLRSQAEPQAFFPLLGTNAAVAWADFQSDAPLCLETDGRVTLPAGTNRAPSWLEAVLPKLEWRGQIEQGPCHFRGSGFQSVAAQWALTNELLHLPDLRVTRPEGELAASGRLHLRAGEFAGEARSSLDPLLVKPWLTARKALRVAEFFHFSTPPFLEASVAGNWREPKSLTGAGSLAVSNLVFRGEAVKAVRTRVLCTNLLLVCQEPVVEREEGQAGAPGLMIDLAAEKLYLTNAFGSLDPYAFTRVINPKTARTIAPYQFAGPPTVRANGTVDLKGGRYEDDLRFEVAGRTFRWAVFQLQEIAGQVHVLGKHVTLSNMHGAFRRGRITGDLRVDPRPPRGDTVAFRLMALGLDLHELMDQVSTKTNRLEGTLNGELVVTHLDPDDAKSWQGHGHARVSRGQLWNTPVFSLLSKALNAIVPGLGNSRATDGEMTFQITNSVIHSADLEVRATAMRMKFQGSVDFDQRLDTQVEAELLRDLPAIGFVVSKVLWPVTKLFEYKVTGTLDAPKAEPLYVVPKVLLFPFTPVKTLKELFAPEK